MLKIAIIVIIGATLVATLLTQSFLAPPIGAAVLFAVMLAGWLNQRNASRANLRKAEEAAHRQREVRVGEDT